MAIFIRILVTTSYYRIFMAEVYVIDDDVHIREYVEVVLNSIDLNVKTYSSAVSFLNDHDDNSIQKGCIISDIVMPDMDGMDFQNELIKKGFSIYDEAYEKIKTSLKM